MTQETITQEIISPRQKPLAFLFEAMSHHRMAFAGMIFMVILGSIAEGFQPYSIKMMIDLVTDQAQTASQQNRPLDMHSITMGLLMTGAFFMFLRLVVFVSWYFWLDIWRVSVTKMETRIRKNMLAHVLAHPYLWFLNSFAGRTSQRIETTARSCTEIIDVVFGNTLYVVLRAVTIVGILLVIDPWLSLGMLGWIVLFVPASIFLANRTEAQSMRLVGARGRHTERVVDIITNIFYVRANGKTVREEEQACAVLADQSGVEQEKECACWLTGTCIRMILNTALYALLFLLCLWRFRVGSITLGDYALVISSSIGLVDTLGEFSKYYQKFFQNMGSLRESLDGLVQKRSARPLLPPYVFDKGAITFEDISFAYHSHASVFQDFSLKLRAGEKVAIVGASGAGKSTLIHLFLGLFPLQKGRILIDGQDLSQVDRESFLNHIAVIPQDTSLFHRSLYENIAFGCGDVSRSALEDAARAAHIHDFISSCPDGYETVVGERGLKLSGGQRQRVAIARAILKNPHFLLLDEATSALDSESETIIQGALRELMKGKTVIAIAHRLSTIASMDRIVVMEHGKIIEEGTQEELIAAQGVYARLWAMQSGGYLPADSDLDSDSDEDAEVDFQESSQEDLGSRNKKDL